MPARPCVLIVEDEPLIALDLQEAMLAVGFYVCGVAHTQAGARSLADSEQPDVILMDVSLEGGREGIEAARSLREAYGAEVIFVTGSTDQYTLDQIHRQVPGAPVMPKPVNHRRLAEAVGAVFRPA
jgi:DNA-binding response OmpR family regulator